MPIADASVDYLRELVRVDAGLGLDPAKAYVLEARLQPVARRAGIHDLDALVALARGRLGANLRRQIVAALAPGTTAFFGEPAAFECLRTEVLPALIAARRAEQSLAVWCAAAATGQEPYTVAMIIHEHFRELLSWKLTFLASDLSPDAVARGRSGRYSEIEINRGLPAAFAAKYLERHGLEWEIVAPVRDMVTFEELNLNRPWPDRPRFDVVLLRNVLGDFDPAARRHVLDRVRAALRPDGYAFLDAGTAPVGFESLGSERAGCYRLAETAIASA